MKLKLKEWMLKAGKIFVPAFMRGTEIVVLPLGALGLGLMFLAAFFEKLYTGDCTKLIIFTVIVIPGATLIIKAVRDCMKLNERIRKEKEDRA